MSTRIGRNPFEKKKRGSIATVKGGKSTAAAANATTLKTTKSAAKVSHAEEATQAKSKSPAERLLVDLPANTFMFALKGVMLVKGIFEKD